jgi:hypothetical protein
MQHQTAAAAHMQRQTGGTPNARHGATSVEVFGFVAWLASLVAAGEY